MTDELTEQEFRRVADSFIDQANEHLRTVQKENVGMALLFAAARFNAFVTASHSPTLDRYEADRPQAVDFFTSKYREMLDENLDDYRRAYQEVPDQS
jgi:hypothetical protein